MPVHPSAAGLLLAALALSACENIPYYNESLNFFSRSPYDPEVKAIEEQTSPPLDSPVLSAPTGPAAMAAPIPGGAILAASPDLGNDPPTTPMSAIPAQEGIEYGAASREQAVTQASLLPPTRIMPPMGLARSKRVIYGDNRGPFQTGNVRTLR